MRVPGLERVVALSSAPFGALALRADGTLWGWGQNDVGQLGNGWTWDALYPVLSAPLEGGVSIAAGHRHGLMMHADGSVWSWGDNTYGQLGDPTLASHLAPFQVF
jgi:alpha-tubulin suppressor-like RCC1 family protein